MGTIKKKKQLQNQNKMANAQSLPQDQQQDRINAMRAEADAVVDIMADNMQQVLERDARLTDIDDKSDSLAETAKGFDRTTKQVKNKMWYQNLKWTIILTIFSIILIAILVVLILHWCGVFLNSVN